MADFDIMESGFDSANETINFGLRHIDHSNLYEISTISCLKSSEEGDNSQLIINALTKNGRVFLTTNKSLKIFGGESLLNIVFNASFKTIVVAICVSNNGEFFALYLKTGQVKVLNIGNNGDVTCIFSDCILDDSENLPGFVDIFDENIVTNLASFLLIFSNGKVKRLYIKKNEYNAYDVLNEDICTLKSTISLACYSYPILASIGTKSVILNVVTKSIDSDISYNLKTLCPLGCKILGLDKDGSLLKICTLTLIVFPIHYDVLFDDIMVINDGKRLEIVGVTQKNEQGELFLKRLRSDFSEVYSLKVRYSVHLIQLQTLADDFLFLSKVSNEYGISELRLQCVKETEPELRLIRLVRRQRFQEAEEFSKAYNLDPLIIMKAKAEHIVRKLECTSEDIDNLIALMDDIGDEYFNLQCCTNIDCSSLSDIKKILDYGTNIKLKNKSEVQDKHLLKQVLSDLLFKFETYLSLSAISDVQSWSTFSTCDLVEETKSFLRNYQIEEAIILYSRLDKKTIITNITDKNIEDILNILDKLPTNTYEPFLPIFIPITMMHRPSALSIFVNWLHYKIIELEKSNQVNFPENAVHFAQKILKLLKVEEKTTILFNRQCILNKKCLEDLSSLMEGLKMIQNLKNNFGLIISLIDSLRDPKELVSSLLDIIMSPGDFDTFLKEFLYNFILENQFDSDKIFSNKIKYLLQFEDSRISIIEVILKYIGSLTTKLETIENMLNKSQVPWCQITRRIGQSALQYSHPIAEKIQLILDDEPIWIILSKYNLNERSTRGIFEYDRIVRRIILVNQPSMVDDIFQICKIPERKLQACKILIDHFIRTGDLERVNSIMNMMTRSEMYECIKFIITTAEVDLNSKRSNPHYYMSLGMLYVRFVECCEDRIEIEQYDSTFQILRGVFNLNEMFESSFVTHDFVNRDEKVKLMNILLKDFVENIEDPPSIANILGVSQKMASYLKLDKDDVLIKMCELIGKFDIVVEAAEYLYKTEADSKHLRLISVLFLKYMGNQTVHSETIFDATLEITISSDVPLDVDVAEKQVYSKAFKLFPKIMSKALCTADSEELPRILEITEWIDNSFYLTYKKSTLQAMLFRDMFSDDQIMTNYSEYSSVLKKCFHMCVHYMGFIKIDRSCPTHIDSDLQPTMEEVANQLSLLPAVIDNFSKHGLHLTAYHLLKTLKTSFMIHGGTFEVIRLLDTLIQKKCLPQLIHFVVSTKYIDYDLLYNLLLEAKGRYLKLIEHYLHVYKRQPRKLHDISMIGIQLQDFYNQTSHKFILLNAVISCKWWTNMKAKRSQLVYDEFFRSSKDSRLRNLIESNLMDIDLIKDYCKDFSLDVEVYYKIYLKSYILNWKLEFDYQSRADGKKSIVIKNDENILHERCQDIINVIEDKSSIFAWLEKILNVVNFYQYEVFICIYKILQNNAEGKNVHMEKLRVLLFLKSYYRCSSPSQREEEEWYTAFPDSQSLDPLSEYRLPFNELIFNSDIWSIVRPEINLKTYKCWFDVASVLLKYLKKDDICVYAVKQVVSSKLLGDNVTTDWILYPKLNDLFEEIDQCVQKISDLERATSVIYHLMYHTPNGVDKVNAAQLSYKYAKKYKDENPNSTDIEKAYVKVKNKYRALTAMHILYKFNLTDATYLELVSNPNSLVEALYMDDRILKKAESVTLECPDINKAVDEISEFFNLEIHEIQYNLLNNWLSSSSANCDMDSTILLPNPTKSETKSIENEDNLKRAMYLCTSNKHTFWQQYLLNISINEEPEQETDDVTKKSFLFKANALKCFCAITDEETIGTMTKVCYTEILNFIEKLSILSELETTGIFLTVEALDQCNKKELLKRLSQSATSTTVGVMAKICITYCIDNTRYWEYLINKSISFGMIDELKMYVDFLKDKYDRSFYLKAWQLIIDTSFQRLTLNMEELDESLISTFLMMQSCPVLFSLNFENVMKICLNLNKYEYAAIVMQFFSDELKKEYSKDICESPTLLKDLAVLEKHGIWGITNVKKWLAHHS